MLPKGWIDEDLRCRLARRPLARNVCDGADDHARAGVPQWRSRRGAQPTAGRRTAATGTTSVTRRSSDRPQQRRKPEGRVAHAPARLGIGAAVLGRSAASGVPRRDLHRHGRERRVRGQRRQRRDPLGVPRESRSEEQRRVLRLDEPRRGARRRQGVRRPARRQARRARPTYRQSRVAGASGALAGGLHDHGGTAFLRRPRVHGVRRRRTRHSRPRKGIRRAQRQAQVDVLHGARTGRSRPRHLAAGQRDLARRRRPGLEHSGRRSETSA